MAKCVRADDGKDLWWDYDGSDDRYLPAAYYEKLDNGRCPYCNSPVEKEGDCEEGTEIREVYACTNKENPTSLCGRKWWKCTWTDIRGTTWKFGD